MLDPQGAKRLVFLVTMSCQGMLGCLLLLRMRLTYLPTSLFLAASKVQRQFPDPVFTACPFQNAHEDTCQSLAILL